jgi:hypothetical protein
MKRIFFIILLLSFLVACRVPEKGATPKVENKTVVTTETKLVLKPSATIPSAPPPENITAPTLAINPTTFPEKRLPPDRWREWPIIPAVTRRALEIYYNGQGMGLDGHAFSKVGDCQSVKAAFMGYFDIPERFSLGNDYAYLQKTIDNFAGHFNTDGQAVKGGFNAAAVLSPLWADPSACLAGENPLECELRVTKPIIVIVSLEVWWDGRTASQYESLMRRILDTIIAHGAVPILATKADNVEGDSSLNLTTARLASEYDLPLWNFWAAVQPLPEHGMDTKRKDGFHISTDAWNTRSFTGLEALDSVWRGLLNAAQVIGTTPSVAATIQSGLLSTPMQDTPPSTTTNGKTIPIGSSNLIVFGLEQRQGDSYTYSGVYLLDLEKGKTRQVFGTGVRFQSASPDGKYLLVSEGSILYRTNLNGTEPLQLTNSLYAFGNSDAIWLSNDRIAVVLAKSGTTEIAIISANGVLSSEVPVTEAAPVEIYPTSLGNFVYWVSGSCSATGICQRDESWVYNIDGKLQKKLEGFTVPVLAPTGSLLVSRDTFTAEQNTLIISLPDGSSPRSYPLPGNSLVDYAWSLKGDALAAIVAIRSDYSGKALGNRNFLIDPLTLSIREYSQSDLLNPQVLWSPDGSSLFWIGTLPSDTGFKLGGSLVNLSSKQVSDLGAAIGQTSQDYLAVTNAKWLSLP